MKNEDFSKMLILQEQEEEIVKRERFIERINQRIKELELGINSILEEQAMIIAELNNLIDQIREQELKVRVCKENLRRWESRAKAVKKIEEYKALLREKAKNEDCVIKGEQRLKELRQARKKLEDALHDSVKRQKLKRLEEEKLDLLKEVQEVRQELEKYNAKFESLKSSIDEHVIQEYQKLKKDVGFPLFVKVDIMGACGNCGTKLPSLLYSKLIKGEKVRCPSCGKILY